MGSGSQPGLGIAAGQLQLSLDLEPAGGGPLPLTSSGLGRGAGGAIREGANAGLCGTFDLATSADGAITLRQDGIEDQTTENKPLVSKVAILFDLIRGNALPRDESRSLILEVAEQWKSG